MKTFILSGYGRILALAFGVALAGSGAAKLLEGSLGTAVGSMAVMIALALAVVALATSIGEHFGAAALTVLVLPWLAFLGEVGRGLLPRSAAAALLVAGLAAFAFALRARAARERAPTELAVTRGI